MGELVVLLGDILRLYFAPSYQLYKVLQGIVFGNPTQVNTVLKINERIANIISCLYQESQGVSYIAHLVSLAYR